MSNHIQYDAFLVHHLASELDERLRGRDCAPLPAFDQDLSVTLPFDRGEALRLDLHPSRGWIRVVPWSETSGEGLTARCTAVSAPRDERRIHIALSGGRRFQVRHREIVIELQANHWNALVTEGEDRRIIAVLRPRQAGGRVLRADTTYEPPSARPRIGADEESYEQARQLWMEVLGSIPPAARVRELSRLFAWTGALNTGPLLGPAATQADPAALSEAFERWWALRSLEPAQPVLLHTSSGVHPYPVTLPGTASTPVASLLDGMEAAADSPAEPSGAEAEERLERAREQLRLAERKAERIAAQLDRAADADRLRAYGDLLLARLHEVPRGAKSATLHGWDGQPVKIPLDPALSPTENANRWYTKARQRARAAEQLPDLLQRAEADAERWRAAIQAGERGEWPAWAAGALDSAANQNRGAKDRERGLPYRQFRTSGGLEVRVGRNSRDNDRLTFGHSAPNDIWLHARSVSGSHVVLRWPDAEASPPARDLAEAAGLAAYFSKARSSGTVAVDWARRKHVRKPRGAPPGAVIPQRVRTIFVEPDQELARRLRSEASD